MNRKNILGIGLGIALLAAMFMAFASPIEDTDEEKNNIAANKKFFSEIFNKGNFAIMDELVSDDFIDHEDFPGLESNKEGVEQFFTMFRAAFPDLKATVEFMFAKDDKVVSYLMISGTHKGEFMGMAATGKKINIKGIDIVRFEEGKAVEHWGLTDSMTMMQQLGAMPMEGHEGH